jgi:hypothetical protein
VFLILRFSQSLQNIAYTVFNWLGPADATAMKAAMFAENGGEERHITSKIGSDNLPTQEMTVEAWVKLYKFTGWGGFVSFMQDDGREEGGFLLGYRFNIPCFAITTEGTGYMTYMASNIPLVPGAWQHLAATYDGVNMRLLINGQVVRQGAFQNGKIKYPAPDYKPKASGYLFSLGAFHDNDEYNPMVGMMADVRIWNVVRTDTQIQSSMKLRLKGNEAGLLHNWRLDDPEESIQFKNSVASAPVAQAKGDILLMKLDAF